MRAVGPQAINQAALLSVEREIGWVNVTGALDHSWLHPQNVTLVGDSVQTPFDGCPENWCGIQYVIYSVKVLGKLDLQTYALL